MFTRLCVPLDYQPPRGGWRQRLHHAPAQARPAPLQALGQLRDWGDGLLSAHQVAAHMLQGVRDGEITHPMVHRLGRLLQNQQDARGIAQRLADMLGECGFDGYMDDTTDPGNIAKTVIYPSQMIRFLRERFPGRFGEILGVDENVLGEFWDGLRACPAAAEHLRQIPGLQNLRPTDWRRVVPLTVHEDAGPFIKNRSANIISFSAMYARGGEKICQLPIASFIKNRALTHAETVSLWQPILRDFADLAARGVGNYRFVLLFAKGDLEARSVTWGLPSYNCTTPCSGCLANRIAGSMPFTDLRADAPWRGTYQMTLGQYVARSRQPLHPLLSSPFMWRYFAPLDVMHLCECNGLTSIAAGSLLRVLVSTERRIGRNMEERLAELNRRLVAFYDLRPNYHRMPEIRQSNLLLDGWHQLHGQTVKAASTRALVPWLVEMAETFHDTDSPYDRLVQRVFRALESFYRFLYVAGVFLYIGERAELHRVLLLLGASWQQLRELARERGLMAWRITPKVHMVMHLDQQAVVCNPRWTQNYTEESQIGTMTQIWGRSARGRYRGGVQRMILLKRLVSLAIRLERPDL